MKDPKEESPSLEKDHPGQECREPSTIKRRKRERRSLEELLAGVTPENIHPETDWGPPVGKEIW